MTVGELMARMSAPEFAAWATLEAIDPLPDFWEAVGLVCATIANANRSGGKAVRPWDILPFLRPRKARDDAAMARELGRWLGR